jgi:hypothetical protein
MQMNLPIRITFALGTIVLALVLVISLGLERTASAVILLRTEDPAANTTEPDGDLAGSGWQYEGNFGAYLGTAIAPHYFITAKHLGKVVDRFVYQGIDYSINREVADPENDLSIFQVTGTLPKYAPLYERNDEVSQHLVVIGRGTQRGRPKIVGGQLRGWEYGRSDSVWRWGENRVAGVIVGKLYVLFQQGGLPNEAHLSAGDSGGAVFLKDGGTWKLAGINSDVDHFASGRDGGGPFDAALFDQRGLYRADGSLVSGRAPVPSGFYAARVSSRLEWIKSVIGNSQGAAVSEPPIR